MEDEFIARTPEDKCHNCGHLIDSHAASVKAKAKPAPGDISICGYCATISKYDSELKLVKVELADLDGIKRNDPKFYDQVMETRLLILQFLDTQKPKRF